ncbi:MAG: tyrosine-type recombinase/integrase [Hyphomicrobiaceae bacterium]
MSERGHELTRQAVNYIIKTAGERAGLGHVHPHMLRHSCATTLPIGTWISAPRRTSLATAIPSIPRGTLGWQEDASKDYGTDAGSG